MKYMCPHCGSCASYKWWKSKIKLKCTNCNQNIFISVKIKLQILNFLTSFIGVLTGSFIFIFIEISIWKRFVLIFLATIVLVPAIQAVEQKICRKATSISKNKKGKNTDMN